MNNNPRYILVINVNIQAIISPELSKQKNHCRSEPTQSASAVNSLEFTENFEDTVKRLIAAFPEEEDAIRSYLRLLQWSKIVFPIFIGLKLAPKLIGSFVGMIFGRLINAYMGTSTKQVNILSLHTAYAHR